MNQVMDKYTEDKSSGLRSAYWREGLDQVCIRVKISMRRDGLDHVLLISKIMVNVFFK